MSDVVFAVLGVGFLITGEVRYLHLKLLDNRRVGDWVSMLAHLAVGVTLAAIAFCGAAF